MKPTTFLGSYVESLEDKIREHAYFLWLERGRPHGEDWEHWFVACQRLLMAIDPGIPQHARPPDDEGPSFASETPVETIPSSDPEHRFHGPGPSHDQRLNVIEGEARQRVRGRRFGGSLRPVKKKRQ